MSKDMTSLKSIVGVGWKFPFQFDGRGGVARQGDKGDTSSIEKIRESLQQILGTFTGERVIRREFGNLLRDLLFDPNNAVLRQQILQFVTSAITSWEPRILLVSVQIDSSQADKGVVLIDVEYIVRKSNVSDNLVYPFYLDIQQNQGT